MLEKYEKKIEIIEKNPGLLLKVSKSYRKRFSFNIEAYLPICFNYSVDRYIRLSFKIFSQNKIYNIENGEWENDKYRGYTIILQNRYAELNTIVTPENHRNNGFATAILDITFEIISLYNEIISSRKFTEIHQYNKIEYITGFISSCDSGKRLSPEQLEEFYYKNGFLIKEGNNIYHYFS